MAPPSSVASSPICFTHLLMDAIVVAYSIPTANLMFDENTVQHQYHIDVYNEIVVLSLGITPMELN